MRAWDLEDNWSMVEEKPYLFIFTFSNEADRRFVLEKGPKSLSTKYSNLRDRFLFSPYVGSCQ